MHEEPIKYSGPRREVIPQMSGHKSKDPMIPKGNNDDGQNFPEKERLHFNNYAEQNFEDSICPANITEMSCYIYELETFIRNNPFSDEVKGVKEAILRYFSNGDRWDSYAKSIADLTDISGAVYDEKSGFIYIIGEKVTPETRTRQLPPLLIDDILTVFSVIEKSEFPGVSIEPFGGINAENKMENETHQVRYLPNSTANTHLGSVLFEIDRQLKGFSNGKDNMTKRPMRMPEKGIIPQHELAEFLEVEGNGHFGRVWFKPKKSEIYYDGNKIWFKNYKMGVLAESQDPAPRFFASHLDLHFDEIADDVPAFKELLRIGKLVALAVWLRQAGIALNTELIRSYVPTPFSTPMNTPVVRVLVGEKTVNVPKGRLSTQIFLVGGVDLGTHNAYKDITEEAVNSEIKEDIVYFWDRVTAESVEPDIGMAWNITHAGEEYTVVRLPLDSRQLNLACGAATQDSKNVCTKNG